MVSTSNMTMNGITFYRGADATADLFNSMTQYISTEITNRTRDLIKAPGFVWGLHIAQASGQLLTITSGVGVDNNGVRLAHLSDGSYIIQPPIVGTASFYLCMKAAPVNVAYKVHPYDGSRKPTETVIGIEFFSSSTITTDIYGNIYPTAGGLVLARLDSNSNTYTYNESIRSPNLTMLTEL